ncbi:hypothetical protein BC937DRAFT_92673 [Endogone sp. FLAS-F59071]|nr:hypothetical protein BC937DRAFT_92673 [Endogone sp. FLAS-F59071]|eukprot:RUS21444.1 hypothetical protein BC937DRAFT_92673 [Endogone sp. FLAS-F59071]
MSLSASFFDILVHNYPSRTVSPDVREFLESVLADESLVSDPASLREETEGFLADAGMEEEELNAFYEALAGGIHGQAEQEIDTGLKKLTMEDREKGNRGTAVPTALPVAAPLAALPTPTDPAISINPKAKRREKKPTAAASAAADSPSVSEPELVAISQQSRFHLETVEAFTTEIDLKQVTITIGDRDLLTNAHLRLKAGVKYGLVGKNGVGKSTLLRVMGNNILVGLPQNVRILHIEQLEDYDDTRSILDTVLSADKEREKTIKEAEGDFIYYFFVFLLR